MKNNNALFLIFFSLFLKPLFAYVASITPNAASLQMIDSSPPSLPPSDYAVNTHSSFKPTIAVIVALLTTIFSVTLLLLLYIRHCKRSHIYHSFIDNGRGLAGATATLDRRKNSGIDRTVIESLPIFRFSSLRGLKSGLECAVCLAKFEPPEVLRLLPKCKHAFHVECVDTWLDAHSTCPLCRYRVDPEDILLIDRQQPLPPPEVAAARVSQRHSSAGEKASGYLLQKPTGGVTTQTASFGRRSWDSFYWNKKNSSSSVGCFDRYQRKDGLLLLTNGDDDGERDGSCASAGVDKTRFAHRIIVSSYKNDNQRWSDVHASDLLYLRSEMIISESRRFRNTLGSRPSVSNDGRNVINTRSVSEITGLKRFAERGSNRNSHYRQRQAVVVSRWLAWISSHSNRTVTAQPLSDDAV